MIIFDLVCKHDHRFEGWFKNSEAFNKQLDTGLLTCPTCGTEDVRKLPTASRLNLKKTSQEREKTPAKPGNNTDVAYSDLVRQLHEYINRNFDDVGDNFANEVRRIHFKEADQRNIRGIATLDEISELDAEGIQTFYLPEIPDKDKMN